MFAGRCCHRNGVHTLEDKLDPNRNHVAPAAMIGILPAQGVYYDPTFLKMGKRRNRHLTSHQGLHFGDHSWSISG